MKKKIISLAVVVLLAVSYLTILAVANTGIEPENSVITAELQSVMDSATATAKIPVSIWTTEVDTAVVEEIALAKSGYNKESIRALVDQGKIDTVTLEDIDKYIAAERRIYAQLQQQAHQAFVEDYAFLKTASTAEGAYMCSYAPMMIVELTTSQIETLAKASYVNTMYYSPDLEVETEMDVSLPTIWADYTRDTGDFDGTGVKIGMVEGGVPLISNVALQNSNIITDPQDSTTLISSFDTEDDYNNAVRHATIVAQIMVSTSGYAIRKGVVPNAELYAAATRGRNGGFYAAVEHLLQQGVVVINMSAGFDYNVGQYTVYDWWVDHIANNHSVHFVKSAGNNSGNITPPGLAYNAITVGSLDDKNTSDWSDDELASSSSFSEVIANGHTPPNKPDLVAPGENITTESYLASGTSCAAPHVTGVVAQLIQQMPALATLQDLMKAILTASISHSEHQYDSTSANATNFDKYGAGVINAQDCTYTNYRGTFASSYFSPSQSNTYKEYTFNATSADTKIRVSLAWIKNVLHSSSDHSGQPNLIRNLADLDLVVIAPDGTEIPLTDEANSQRMTNLVIMQFNPAIYGYGTYKIRVYIKDSTGANTYFGLAWW